MFPVYRKFNLVTIMISFLFLLPAVSALPWGVRQRDAPIGVLITMENPTAI
jgi:hypothetical protein